MKNILKVAFILFGIGEGFSSEQFSEDYYNEIMN